MALRSVSRLSELVSLRPQCSYFVAKRFMALDGLKGYGEREQSQEVRDVHAWIDRSPVCRVAHRGRRGARVSGRGMVS